ncbi:MAG: hypothetical protein M8357_00045 [Desulfobulbaceae bacterium]|nr:hypothetical protein [Desulfobulbaceae bacterium]
MTEYIRVVCHAGYRADESPVRFFLGERKIEVEVIVDRWTGQDHRYFKVRGDDGGIYIIRQDIIADSWELTFFDRLDDPEK